MEILITDLMRHLVIGEKAEVVHLKPRPLTLDFRNFYELTTEKDTTKIKMKVGIDLMNIPCKLFERYGNT